MWPLQTPSDLGKIPCPAGGNCELPYCLFFHDAVKREASQVARATDPNHSHVEAQDSKRLKLNDSIKGSALQAKRAADETPGQTAFVGSIISKGTMSSSHKDTHGINNASVKKLAIKSEHVLRSVTRSISPPAKSVKTKPASTPPGSETKVPLMPRKLLKDPASFNRRLAYLQALRKDMASFNTQVLKSANSKVKALYLDENQLNKLAVEEEAKIALENGSVYDNIVKKRITALRKASLNDWIKERKEAVEKEKGQAPDEKPPEPVKTGLSPKEEVILLSRLICPQAGLDAHGYVTALHTEEELETTRKGLLSADNWEACDRCNTRFQVFPDRRKEDGALTSGGKCRYHWGRRVFSKKEKGEVPGPTRLSCCNDVVGSPGCSTHDTHVFKVSEGKRLATIMPFVETPLNESAKPHTAICFDCEMGYTTLGLELVRLTAVSWPSHEPIIDVLVRPLGHILDVNTRFSGVRPDQLLNASKYDPANPKINPKDLQIVDSPKEARDLLLSHISRDTPLLGHAIENDLNAVRLVHPTIIDTILLFPHRMGLPYRTALKTLAKGLLKWEIQQAGAEGHDSYEDARATGELVRTKVAREWKKLKDEGWTIRDEGLLPPLPPDGPVPQQRPPAPNMIARPINAQKGPKALGKRKFSQYDGADDEEMGTEDAEGQEEGQE